MNLFAKYATHIGRQAHWIAIGCGVLIFAGALFSDRDQPRRIAVDIREVNRAITPEDLALLFIGGRRDFEVLDMRPAEEYSKEHIRGAISCPACHENKQAARGGDSEMPDFGKKIILYNQAGKELVGLPRILATHPELYMLRGGYDAWRRDILTPPVITGNESDEQLAAKKRAAAIRKFFTGPQGGGAEPSAPDAPKAIKKKPAHNLGKSEGC